MGNLSFVHGVRIAFSLAAEPLIIIIVIVINCPAVERLHHVRRRRTFDECGAAARFGLV